MITKKRLSYQIWPQKFRKNLTGQVFLSIFFAFLTIGVIGFLIFTNWKINQKRTELREKIENLKREIQTLEQKTTNLKDSISQTKSKSYQTERLYEQGYFEEGENPVIILPPEEKKEEKNPESKSIWQKFLESLKF